MSTNKRIAKVNRGKQSQLTLLGFLAVVSLLSIRMNLFLPHSGIEPDPAPEVLRLDESLSGLVRRKSPEGAMDCRALLQGGRNGTVEDPNKGQLLSRFTAGYPQFWVSIHVAEYDPVRYDMLKKGIYYESILSESFTEILKEDKGGHVIDVGGNIGWFTLLSRAMGHTVDTFEPHPSNILRLCESMCLNGWEVCNTVQPMLGELKPSKAYVDVHPIGLLHEPSKLVLESKGASPGQGRLRDTATKPEAINVSVSTLDAMAEKLGWLKKDIAILKVDVEGREFDVFNGAQQLIKSGRVRNIFMEGNVYRKRKPKFLALSSFLIESGYVAHKIGGYKGPSRIYEPPPGENYTSGLVWACTGFGARKVQNQCNMWWKLSPNATIHSE